MHSIYRGSVNRRRILQLLAVGPGALALALRDRPAMAEVKAVERLALAPRNLSLHNLHTGERLALCYFDNGQYVRETLTQFNRLLRDHRSGEVAIMDQRLFDRLHALAVGAQCTPHFEVISGYRSPQTNEALRATSEGVARHSLHTEGRAIDVRLAGTACSRLRDLALDLGGGGVGYYAQSDFVHLDTGRVRSWKG
ncbi:MAG TPA: DUF882 domain-containing protein [Steroidobacteraceae bacterium]|nr:DUF882 domain-containing protein [Steroidobacteraceae bacterium]